MLTACTVVPHRLPVANEDTAAGVGVGCRTVPETAEGAGAGLLRVYEGPGATQGASLNLFNHQSNFGRQSYHIPNYTDEETEDKRGSVLCLNMKVKVVSDSLRPHGLYSPWNSPSQNTGVGSLPFLSPGDLPNPVIKPGSPALQVDSLLTEL